VAEPVIIEDFFPSILEMAGVRNYSHLQTLDGQSFVPLLRRQASTTRGDRSLYWHFPNRWDGEADGSLAYSAVRHGDYKFIFRWHTGKMELYNIKEDIGERTNLISSSNTEVQAIANSLKKNLSDYLRSVNAQRPSSKVHGKILPWPDEAFAGAAPPAP
jgi:arylsulfatase A-like enzyme